MSNAVSANRHGWSHWIANRTDGSRSPAFVSRYACNAAAKAGPVSTWVPLWSGVGQKKVGSSVPSGSTRPRRPPVGAPRTVIPEISFFGTGAPSIATTKRTSVKPPKGPAALPGLTTAVVVGFEAGCCWSTRKSWRVEPACAVNLTCRTSRAVSSVTTNGLLPEIFAGGTSVSSTVKSPRRRTAAGSIATLLSGEGSTKPRSNVAR